MYKYIFSLCKKYWKYIWSIFSLITRIFQKKIKNQSGRINTAYNFINRETNRKNEEEKKKRKKFVPMESSR